MAAYKVFFRKPVRKDFESITKKDLQRILKRIEKLMDDPRPRGCEKLADQDRYRIRQGMYRIVYSIRDDVLTVWVVKVGRRKDVYRR